MNGRRKTDLSSVEKGKNEITGNSIAYSKKVFVPITVFLLIFALILSSVSCAGDKTPKEKTLIRIATLKGPTGIGMVNLLKGNEDGKTKNKYEVEIAGAPDEITGKIINGQLDIAAVPSNLAATLYNKTNGEVQILALNTLGVLYILEKGDEVSSVNDLAGKKLYASGKGSTPEFILNHILKENGLDPEKDLEIEYKTEHTELMTLAASGDADLLILPEPFVTNLLEKNSSFKLKLDITKEWEKLNSSGNSQGEESQEDLLAMGALIVRTEFAKANKNAIKLFLDEYKDSVEKAVNDLDGTGDLMVKYNIMPSKEIAVKAIPGCNIVFIAGKDIEPAIKGFYNVLFESDPKSLGGKIPGEDFYYVG